MTRLVTLLIVSGLVPGLGPSSGTRPDQAKCTLTTEKSPTLRGMRLGMAAEQLYTLFPEGTLNKKAVVAAEGYPNYGVAKLFFQPFTSTLASQMERFAGIDSIQIALFDGRVTELRLDYAGQNSQPVRGPVWGNVDDFIAKLSETLALPKANDWLERSRSSKTLQCTGFIVAASIDEGKASVSLRATSDYQDTVRQRASSDEERRRREFKP